MYTVKTKEDGWQRINSFKTWDKDENFFIFYWADNTHIIIRKDLIYSIQKH